LTIKEKNVINEDLNETKMNSNEDFSQDLENLLNIIMCRFREIHFKIKFYRILLRFVFNEIERLIYSKHS